MKILLIILAALGALGGLVWLGLTINPRPLDPYPGEAAPSQSVPLPNDLPAPVARFYREVYGDRLPLYTSAVISGRGRLRVNSITFPARWRFVHQAGQAYRHYIALTFYGQTIMRVNEHYLEGAGRLQLPFGVEKGPKVDQGANLGLWAESIWFPSIWITDDRVRWQAIDQQTALLVVPYGQGEQTFVARFDPDSGLLRMLESMRYKGAAGEEKVLWLNEIVTWKGNGGPTIPTQVQLTWYDEGTPWAVLSVDEVTCNADLADYVRAEGP